MRASILCLALCLVSWPVGAESPSLESSSAQGGQAGKEEGSLKFSGYVRARYGHIFEGDDGPAFIGINDGFSLENARFIIDHQKGRLGGRVSFDGAVDRRAAANTSVGRVDVGLKDAYMSYALADAVEIQVGQFKPPFDAEELQSTTKMLFIDRAVASRGVRGVEGYNVGGLSLDRQAGIMAHGGFAISGDWSLGYGLSVTNGSGANHPENDNDQLAYTGRLNIEQSRHLSLGGGIHMNRVTGGAPPDQLSEDVMAWAVDFKYARQISSVGIVIEGQFIQSSTQSVDVDTEPALVAQGYHGAFGLQLPGGYVVAYRYATLDPTAEFEAEDPSIAASLDQDALTLHTAGVGYESTDIPLKMQLNYTLVMEDAGRELDNDRVDLLVQTTF